MFIWILTKIKEFFPELGGYIEKTQQLQDGLEDLVHRLRDQTLGEPVAQTVLTGSPYTGVIGHLFSRSKGEHTIDGVTKYDYLQFLGEAIQASRESYYTIQPSGLSWFKDSDEFLQRFADLAIQCVRILLVDDDDVIRSEHGNQQLCEWYSNRAGVNTRTYWITRTDFVAIQKVNDRLHALGTAVDIQDEGHTDVVVCDRTLCFQYDQHRNGHLRFWHGRRGEAFPCQLIFDALEEEQRGAAGTRTNISGSSQCRRQPTSTLSSTRREFALTYWQSGEICG